MNSNSFIFSSESVSEGHPDKVADQISDTILDKILSIDKNGRSACETFVTTGLVLVGGEYAINSKDRLDIDHLARETIKKIGYDDPSSGFDYRSCAVLNLLHSQSSDISQGVNRDDPKKQGAGDQGIIFGFACNETRELMPIPITIANKILLRLRDFRKSNKVDFLRPDAKAQVSIEYKNGKPVKIKSIVLSSQHSENVKDSKLKSFLIEDVINRSLPEEMFDKSDITYHINPTGRFVTGGPHGDAGLTGRKIIVDTYGGMGSHGGGAFSGKDPSKVDRSASYMARYVAKNLVASGLMDRCQIQISYAIGVAEPVSIMIDSFDTAKIDPDRIYEIVRDNFDFTPYGIISLLDLRRPIYSLTSAYGHFGRELDQFSWEKKDMVEKLRSDGSL